MTENVNKYFLPYQVDAILDEHRLMLIEKSIRVGFTFCMAFRAVRRRIEGHGDCLVTSVSLPAAKEFIEQCRKYNEIYKYAASEIEAVSWGKELNEQGFCITYPNGCRIFAFSSNPKAVRSFGGEVMIDEPAFHEHMKEMLKAAGGRAMWGHPVTMWSSHNGADSEWNQFLAQEKAKGSDSKWHIKTVTLIDALDQGLLDKINAVSNQHKTREEFIAETKEMLGGEEAYEEECLCKPKQGGASAIKWQWILAAKREYKMLRFKFTGDDLTEVTGAAEAIVKACQESGSPELGYDVARTGDLAAVWVNRRDGTRHIAIGLVTFKNSKFSTQKALLMAIFKGCASVVGAGDKTGLGMQICEELEEEFGQARFIGINFGTAKPDLGTRLTKFYEQGDQELPAGPEYDEVFFDLAGIRQDSLPSGRIHFYESTNPVNKASHCDMAWANALALAAGAEGIDQGYYL